MAENTERNLDIGKKKKIIIGIVAVVVVVAIVVFFATAKMRNYSKAGKQYKQGNYEEAMKIYLSLGEYKDSKNKYDLSSHMDKVSKDTTMPVIDGIPSEEIVIDKGDTSFEINSWIEDTLKISDDVSHIEKMDISMDDDNFDINVTGKYNVKYVVTDEAGNRAETTLAILVREPSIVRAAYEEAKAIDNTNVEKSSYSVTYNGITISSEEQEWLEDGAVYRSLAKKLEGFNMGFDNKETIALVCGIDKQMSREEMIPYVEKANLVVTRENTLNSVMQAFEAIDCVQGTFDYADQSFDFEITDLKLASEQLGISEKMLGYTLAMLDEYAPTVEFGENSYKCMWFRR